MFYLFWCTWTSFTNSSWRNQSGIPESSRIVAPFWPFSLLLYYFKTEFKIKSLVNLVTFFSALLFLLLPPCGWTAASHQTPALISTSTKFTIFTPRIYLHKQKSTFFALNLDEYAVDIFQVWAFLAKFSFEVMNTKPCLACAQYKWKKTVVILM